MGQAGRLPRQGSSGELPPSVRGVAPGTVLSWQPRPQEFLARRQERPQVPSRRLSFCDLAQSPELEGYLQFFYVNYLPCLAASPEASLPALHPPPSLSSPTLPPCAVSPLSGSSSPFSFIVQEVSWTRPQGKPEEAAFPSLLLARGIDCITWLPMNLSVFFCGIRVVIPVLYASRTDDHIPNGDVEVWPLHCIWVHCHHYVPLNF